MREYRKWDIVLAKLDPTVGAEIAKTRPCLIVSPNKLNNSLLTVIIVPLTGAVKNYSSRLSTSHKGKPGSLAFDQIKAIDKSRVIKKDGELDKGLRPTANALLQIMFSEV